jgi:hypothetical protein
LTRFVRAKGHRRASNTTGAVGALWRTKRWVATAPSIVPARETGPDHAGLRNEDEQRAGDLHESGEVPPNGVVIAKREVAPSSAFVIAAVSSNDAATSVAPALASDFAGLELGSRVTARTL